MRPIILFVRGERKEQKPPCSNCSSVQAKNIQAKNEIKIYSTNILSMAQLSIESLLPTLLTPPLSLARLIAIQKLAFGNSTNKTLLTCNGAIEQSDLYYSSTAHAEDAEDLILTSAYLSVIRVLTVNNPTGRERIANDSSSRVISTLFKIILSNSASSDFTLLSNALTTLCAVVMNNDNNIKTAAQANFSVSNNDLIRVCRGRLTNKLLKTTLTFQNGEQVGSSAPQPFFATTPQNQKQDLLQKLTFLDALFLPLVPTPKKLYKICTKSEHEQFKATNLIRSGLDIADNFVHLSADESTIKRVYELFFENEGERLSALNKELATLTHTTSHPLTELS